MIKKLKARRGTTIVEMLVAVVLLALLTAGGIIATAAVMTSYIHMREVSNAEILASTVIETLSNEIRLGRDITDPGEGGSSNTLKLDSSFFGEDTSLTLDADNRLVAQGAGSSGSDKQLLSKSAYHGLHLERLTFSARKDASGARLVYTIGFAVCNGSGRELWNDSSAAVPMQ